jgi:hypothetical protein
LLHKNTAEKIEMLRQVGINFHDYPESFRQGTFTKKFKKLVAIDDHTWSLIPDANKPASREVIRSAIEVINDVPKLTSLTVSQGSFRLFHAGQ